MSRGTISEREWLKKAEPYSVLVSKTAENAYVAESGNTGEVIYGPSGDAATVIQAAINSLPTGGSVFVKKAIYEIASALVISNGVKLVSDGATLKRTASTQIFRIVDKDDVTIEGFIIDGNFINGAHMVYVEGSTRIRVIDNKFINPPNNAFMLTFQVTPSYYCTVMRNYFDGSGVTGRDAFAGVPFKSVIDGNFIVDSPWGGITSGVVEDTIISNNVIVNSKGSGLSIDSGTSSSYRVTFANNIVLNPGNMGINVGWNDSYPCYDIIIKGNCIFTPAESGIVALYGKRIIVEGNYVEKPKYVGISIEGYDDIVIKGNIVIDPNDANQTMLRLGTGIQVRARHDYDKNFVILGNVVRDQRDTKQMLIGIGVVISTVTNVYYMKDGIIENNVIEGWVNSACGLINASYNNYNHDWNNANITTKVGRNKGYVTENSGTATIGATETSVVVDHGCSYTPSARDVSVILTNLPTNDIGDVYVDTFTSTQFTIHCRNAPGTATAIFNWAVRRT